jgi:hypothetical protein
MRRTGPEGALDSALVDLDPGALGEPLTLAPGERAMLTSVSS